MDIYSLGAVLYELLSGHPPFQVASKLKVFLQVRNDLPKSLRQVRSGISPDLEAICLKCLAKDPKQRYETASALADADLLVARRIGDRFHRRGP